MSRSASRSTTSRCGARRPRASCSEILTQELAPFELVEETVESDRSVVLFETSLRGQAAHGLNVVAYRPDGLVGELTVFFRPVATLQLNADAIGGHMERRFGPRDDLP